MDTGILKRNPYFQAEYAELNKLAISQEIEDHIKFIALFEHMTDEWGFMPAVKRTYLRPDFNMAKDGPVALPRNPVIVHEKESPDWWQLRRPDGTRDDIVQLTIDLMFTNEEILQAIDDTLTKKRKSIKRKPLTEKTRKRVAKWKLYLMVYDLREKHHLTFDAIGSMLSEAGLNSFEDRTLENYYKKAEQLINGGYKKYLPKPPQL